MRISTRVRALAIGVAAGSMLAVPLAAPASALTSSVACAKLTASTAISGKNATTKSCGIGGRRDIVGDDAG
jgi:hypothetical protein